MSSRKTIRHWWHLAVPGLVLAAAGSTAVHAQDSAAAQANADAVAASNAHQSITAGARAVLDRMEATMGGLTRYSVVADVTRDEVRSFSYKMQHNETSRMWVEAPNRLRIEVDGDIKSRTYVYDGSTFTIFAPDENVWSSTKAPATTGETIRQLLDADVEMPLVDMLYVGSKGDLLDKVNVGIVVGESTINGVTTDHLAFRQPDLDWQLWVTKGAQALPVKMVITTRHEVGDPQYSATLRWEVGARIDAASFAFVPPRGATEVPMTMELFETGEAK